jgi:hypothetical protein
MRVPFVRISGLPRQNDIWVMVLWPSIECTIRGKVVASPKSGPWWVLWVRVCLWFVREPKCSNYVLTNLLFCLCMPMWVIDACHSSWSSSRSSSTPLYPQSAASQGVHPNSFSFRSFHLWIRSWVHRGAWGASIIVDLVMHVKEQEDWQLKVLQN